MTSEAENERAVDTEWDIMALSLRRVDVRVPGHSGTRKHLRMEPLVL